MTGFQFKQFFVAHDRCAMKVGTDGVLLGAVAADLLGESRGDSSSAFRVLDIGTGTGLVALMLAQKLSDSPSWHIDAIDIDPDAVEQARENFSRSPWAEHLGVFHASLQTFSPSSLTPHPSSLTSHPSSLYSLIVSNPPYFVNSLKNPDAQRQTARHTDTLSYDDLLRHSVRLLAPEGRLVLILPTESEVDILRLAAEYGLAPSRILYIHTTATKPPKRLIVELHPLPPTPYHLQSTIYNLQSSIYNLPPTPYPLQSTPYPLPPTTSHLTLMGPHGEPRSAEYSALCRDYYL